jgi:tRNA G10  N-methylase Trm11
MADVEVPHPSKYSKSIQAHLKELVDKLILQFDHRPISILDPMAGVGTIHQLARPGSIDTLGLEIEPEWADQHPDTIEGDATAMPFHDDYFDLVIFSPPYGNRMADQFVSKDGTYRVTYYHFLNRRLHENSAAGKHFGPAYCKTMRDILIECKRVVTPNGAVVINVSNFIKAGEVIDVIQWYIDSMVSLGFRVVADDEVATRRMRYGANHKLRVGSEHVITFKLRRF